MPIINSVNNHGTKAAILQEIEEYHHFLIQAKIHEEIIRKEALKEGREEAMVLKDYQNKLVFVTNLIKNTDFNDEKIASLAGADVPFVQKIRADSLFK